MQDILRRSHSYSANEVMSPLSVGLPVVQLQFRKWFGISSGPVVLVEVHRWGAMSAIVLVLQVGEGLKLTHCIVRIRICRLKEKGIS
jgi:hypothetical protein